MRPQVQATAYMGRTGPAQLAVQWVQCPPAPLPLVQPVSQHPVQPHNVPMPLMLNQRLHMRALHLW